jgi:hypothetical protein
MSITTLKEKLRRVISEGNVQEKVVSVGNTDNASALIVLRKRRVVDMLKTVTQQLEDEKHPERLFNACWRLADAGGLLRTVIDAEVCGHLQGYDEDTYLGCCLPTINPDVEIWD